MQDAKIFNLAFKWHLIIGIFIRLLLIFYSDYHDRNYDVEYTDIDYKVFTDAARFVFNGDSPYKRHTYRYSPMIAYLMVPNVLIWKNFGKCLFSIFDVLITVAVKKLIENRALHAKQQSAIAIYSSLFWLYNPLSIAISTRGNADSFPCFVIIMSIYFLQMKTFTNSIQYVLSGVLLGIAVHLRLYPLVFSFPMYLALGNYKINRGTSVKNGLLSLVPNKNQIILTLSCIISLFLLTYGMYMLYGYEFLFETYIYHLFRKDTRHNFSVLFYYSYLTMDLLTIDIVKLLSQIFECIILFVLSLTFGPNLNTLPFALFCQAVVLVTYNSVMTSQYFIWYLSLMPLVIHNIQMPVFKAIFLSAIWLLAQSAWLFYAYLLEFKSREVFIFIWLKGIIFFCTNIFVLGQLIKHFSPGPAFGQLHQNKKEY